MKDHQDELLAQGTFSSTHNHPMDIAYATWATFKSHELIGMALEWDQSTTAGVAISLKYCVLCCFMWTWGSSITQE
jgi:hypothetical protein